MTDTPDTPEINTPAASEAERIAKVIARSGVASRRDAEKMILEGRVTVNGKTITSPALDVTTSDKIVIDGKAIDAPQETRLWLYYKPLGLVTTEKDDQGRRTIFDEMPEGMPRVLNVGRLDLNSEGLLLLTNDGGLKRRLEHPETAWLRKYRVRVNGRPTPDAFNPLREGIVIDGEEFQPMEISLDRQQGANAWLTVGIREGKNREIRRAMTAIDLTVNRLIRVSYGPFRLNEMEPGDVVEIRRKVMREQLGDKLLMGIEDGRRSREERLERTVRRTPKDRDRDDRNGDGPRKSGFGSGFSRGPRDDNRDRDGDAPKKGFGRQRDFSQNDAQERRPRWDKSDKPRADGFRSHRDDGDRRDFAKKPFGANSFSVKPRLTRDADAGGEDRKPYGKRPYADRDGARQGGFDKKPFGKRPYGDRDGDRDGNRDGNRNGGSDRGDRPARSFGARDGADRKPGGFKSEGFRSHGAAGKPRTEGFKSHRSEGRDQDAGRSRFGGPRAEGSRGDAQRSEKRDYGDRKDWGDRKDGDRKFGDLNFGDRKDGDRKDGGWKPRGTDRADRPYSGGGKGGFRKDGAGERNGERNGDRGFERNAGGDRGERKPGGFKSSGFGGGAGARGGAEGRGPKSDFKPRGSFGGGFGGGAGGGARGPKGAPKGGKPGYKPGPKRG